MFLAVLITIVKGRNNSNVHKEINILSKMWHTHTMNGLFNYEKEVLLYATIQINLKKYYTK